MSNPQDQLINFAIKELNKVLQDIKDGKTPEMPVAMEKLASELEMANKKRNSMTEDEIKQWAERIVQEVSNLEE